MKQLSTAVLNAAVRAHRDYDNRSGGYWLWHAPEFFLTVHVARGIGRRNWEVWCDASPRKIVEANTAVRQGRQPLNKNHRFDIVVWHKSEDTVKALIEVKKAWSIATLKADVRKLRKQSRMKKAAAKAGYLLVYSEAKHKRHERIGRDAVLKRFKRWSKELRTRLAGTRQYAPREEKWAWGFALLRVF